MVNVCMCVLCMVERTFSHNSLVVLLSVAKSKCVLICEEEHSRKILGLVFTCTCEAILPASCYNAAHLKLTCNVHCECDFGFR